MSRNWTFYKRYQGNIFNSWSLLTIQKLWMYFHPDGRQASSTNSFPCRIQTRATDGASRERGRQRTRTLTQQVLHDEHVVLPQVAEGSPARLAIREGVVLYPAATGKVVEVMTGVNRLIQATHDHTGHGDARLCEAQARMSCKKSHIFITWRSFHIPRQEAWLLGKHFCGYGGIIWRYLMMLSFWPSGKCYSILQQRQTTWGDYVSSCWAKLVMQLPSSGWETMFFKHKSVNLCWKDDLRGACYYSLIN